MSESRKPSDEVLEALEALASESGATDASGARIQADRGSQLRHLGVRTPLRRRRVKQGFSFSSGSDVDVLAGWDSLWQSSDVADVLFTPLDHYREGVPDDIDVFWATVSQWITRVDNWAHADDLARVYSRALEANNDVVHPSLVRWSQLPDQWHRRISMVSLIRYSGKNVNFMPTSDVLAVVANCVDDERDTVAKAAGWVLREIAKSDEAAVKRFLRLHGSVMPAAMRRRAHAAMPDE